jgi:hypothetical protein
VRFAAGSIDAPDLERLRGNWDDCQANRGRNAIYGYLNAVYGLLAWWAAEGREIDRARRELDGRCAGWKCLIGNTRLR